MPHLSILIWRTWWMMCTQTHNCTLTLQQHASREGSRRAALGCCVALSPLPLLRSNFVHGFLYGASVPFVGHRHWGQRITHEELNRGAFVLPFRASTHHSRKTCWPPACALRLLQPTCQSDDCTCLCSWSWGISVTSLPERRMLPPVQLFPERKSKTYQRKWNNTLKLYKIVFWPKKILLIIFPLSTIQLCLVHYSWIPGSSNNTAFRPQ